MEGVSRLVRIVDAHAKVLETVLECVGLWKVAQRVRRRMSRHVPLDPSHREKLKVWIQAHVDLDLTVQRLGQYKWMQLYRPDETASFTSEWSSDVELVPLEDKIAAYHKCALTMQQALQEELDGFPDCPVKRAILSLRRNSQWDNSKWLQTQCGERGGCCSRGCGCCQTVRDGIVVKGTGHCTSACICCEENRGFHISTSEGDPSGPFQAANVLDVYDNQSQNGWLNAFVWGL